MCDFDDLSYLTTSGFTLSVEERESICFDSALQTSLAAATSYSVLSKLDKALLESSDDEIGDELPRWEIPQVERLKKLTHKAHNNSSASCSSRKASGNPI